MKEFVNFIKIIGCKKSDYHPVISLCLLSLFFVSNLMSSESSTDDLHWNQWRGPNMDGIHPHADPPVNWSERGKDSINVKWKAEIPGSGHSSPVIWKDQVFLLSAIEVGEKVQDEARKKIHKELPVWRRAMGGKKADRYLKFILLAFDRKNGNIDWERTLVETLPHEGVFKDGSWASASPVTDGEILLAFFGSYGLYCCDLEGNVQWQKEFGQMNIIYDFGEGATPIIYEDTVIVNWDHEGESFIIALDKLTGEEIWRQNRDETTTWSTPIVVDVDGKIQIITSGNKRTRSYDWKSGQLLWEAGGLGINTIPTPIFKDGIVYVASGYTKKMMQAIRVTDAKGDITGTDAIIWQQNKNVPYTPSLLLYDDVLYGLKSNKGILSCYDPKSGEVYYGPERLPGIKGVFASPVAANGKVYLIGRNGTSIVIKSGRSYEVIAENFLDDKFDSSPAIAENEMYLRGHSYLYCVREQK